jgi:hypothetical protein
MNPGCGFPDPAGGPQSLNMIMDRHVRKGIITSFKSGQTCFFKLPLVADKGGL